MAVSFGGIVLDGFEAPAGFRFGGDQRLAIHSLPGGTRVIDAMGPDEADISWRGFLSGNNAASRARQLDAMRQAGDQITLAWDAVCCPVVISRIHFIYHSAWWIQCDIRCTVVSNSAAEIGVGIASAVAQITADLTAAGGWINVTAATAAIAAPGAAFPGTQANASASLIFSSLTELVSVGIAAAESALGGQDIASVVAAAGNLAGLTAARGYIGRAAVNLANAGA